MTIKQQGGVFGRNPTFNDVTAAGEVATNNLTTASGSEITVDKSMRLLDGQSLLLGTGSDLRIRHTGSLSEISDEGTGVLYIRSYGGGIYFQTGGVNNRAWFNDTGNLAFASGLGIDFSATSGTGTSELFDDYEEGTWTPVLSDGTNDATMSANSAGSYTKVGRLIVLNASVETTSLGSVTGAIRITGLPYSNLTGLAFYASSAVGYGELLNITAGQSVGVAINSGNAHINLNLWDAAGGISQMQASEWSADGVITFSISYFGA